MTKGIYTFKWSGEADEVFVTGSFDKWSKSEKLVKGADNIHLGSVELEVEKTIYKYVVDGNWTIDPKQRVEKDESGNDNNYLLPEDIVPKDDPIVSVPVIPDTADEVVAPFIQSAGPTATTADLAAEVPLEPKREVVVEEAKPEEPVVEIPEKKEEPLPPAPAAISSVGPEATTAALAAEVPLEEVAKAEPIVPEATKAIAAPEDLPTPDPKSVPGFLPDTADAEEPKDETVKISPIPASETATNPIDLAPGEPVPPSTASVTDNVKLDEESYEKADASNLGVGETAAAALAAVTAAVTTAVSTVAEKVIPESVLPIVGKEDPATATTETVPPVVTDSQAKAEVEPEASAVPEAVVAKAEVEEELVEKTEVAPPIPVTTETPSADVPEVVRESQAEASAPLEASASPVAVEAKKEIEAELKEEVKPVEPIPETPAVKPSEAETVPAVVTASIEKAGETSEAVANPVAVEAKEKVEEAITKGETKVEPVEPPKTEEPSTAEKAVDAAEKVADKVVPETTKTGEKPAETTEAAAPAKEKRRKRLSAFFHKVAKKLS
ncbi:Zonadhesin [Dactylella cylindrospora]|nr:Zonadhesin [Dactylella cylindrospora]